jgi:hypothetical protein
MKPFRKHVGIAIDGGGIRGIIVTRALAILEDHLGRSAHETFRLAAGTSTGSVVSAGIAVGLTGAAMHRLYHELAATVFPKTWRSRLWPLTRCRYPIEPLREQLTRYVSNARMGSLWQGEPCTDLVITTFDLVTNHTCFVKPWKDEYTDWPIVQAVLASCSVPTYFPVIEGRYVDGGVGSYANPCYLAAYEARFCLDWDPAETTIISLGTGRLPHTIAPGEAERFWTWQWLVPILGAFQQSADDQQVHLVDTFFEQLDFRRFQVDLREPIQMDDISKLPELTAYGDELGRMVLNDQMDRAMEITIAKAF